MFAKYLAFHDVISCSVRRHMMARIEGVLAREARVGDEQINYLLRILPPGICVS